MVKPRTAPFELEPLILNDKICENCAARGLSRPSDRRAASQAARPPVLGQRPLHLPAHLLQRAALSHFAGDSYTPNVIIAVKVNQATLLLYTFPYNDMYSTHCWVCNL